MDSFTSHYKSVPEYLSNLENTLTQDLGRLEETKKHLEELPSLKASCYSSIKWPVKLLYPFFEARTAYAVPHNYFQQVHIDGEKIGNMFSHGSTRSVFFIDNSLYLFSKIVNHREGEEFFTSFLLVGFTPSEFSHSWAGNSLTLSVDCKKTLKNLITERVEKRQISFTFQGLDVKGKIVSRERVNSSSTFSGVYQKYGGASKKSASIDLEGYALTVPHFAPHPYLLKCASQFGFKDEQDMQEHVVDYFKQHLP